MKDDLISRSASVDALCVACNKEYPEEPCEPSECLIRQALATAPAVDAVEVVRCRDCRMMCEDKIFGNLWCNRMNATYKVKPDDFCSYGERKDND